MSTDDFKSAMEFISSEKRKGPVRDVAGELNKEAHYLKCKISRLEEWLKVPEQQEKFSTSYLLMMHSQLDAMKTYHHYLSLRIKTVSEVNQYKNSINLSGNEQVCTLQDALEHASVLGFDKLIFWHGGKELHEVPKGLIYSPENSWQPYNFKGLL